ncbi:hypothetical protein AB6D11_03040 [Vibrio splendidus]
MNNKNSELYNALLLYLLSIETDENKLSTHHFTVGIMNIIDKSSIKNQLFDDDAWYQAVKDINVISDSEILALQESGDTDPSFRGWLYRLLKGFWLCFINRPQAELLIDEIFNKLELER